MTLGKQDYDERTYAIVDIGYGASMKMAKQEIMVKSVVRSIADAWPASATPTDKCQTLKNLLAKWTNEILTTSPVLWRHLATIVIAQVTAIGIMAKELPIELHGEFADTLVWSDRGNILDSWHSVVKSLEKRGLDTSYVQSRVIST